MTSILPLILASFLSFVGIFVVFLLTKAVEYLKGISTRLDHALITQERHAAILDTHKDQIAENKHEIKELKIIINQIQLAT